MITPVSNKLRTETRGYREQRLEHREEAESLTVISQPTESACGLVWKPVEMPGSLNDYWLS